MVFFKEISGIGTLMEDYDKMKMEMLGVEEEAPHTYETYWNYWNEPLRDKLAVVKDYDEMEVEMLAAEEVSQDLMKVDEQVAARTNSQKSKELVNIKKAARETEEDIEVDESPAKSSKKKRKAETELRKQAAKKGIGEAANQEMRIANKRSWPTSRR